MFASRVDSKQCREKVNFVFIKCMKCATETLETIFRRFGYVRDLNFVLPIEKRIYLGWPYLMEPDDYKPPRKLPWCSQCPANYNILCEHAIYNRTSMRLLMPSDTIYITIIREPYSRLVSTFNYFLMKQFLNITQLDALSEYINNYRKYESIYKSAKLSKKRNCIPDNFSLSENLMAHCLGMPLGFPSGRKSIASDPEAITKYIKLLDKDFSLVMIVEYFHESLILLRRLMCWTFKDIIYLKVNMRYPQELQKGNPKMQKQQEQLYRKYSPVDYMLYDYFNQTFWEKVALQNDGFFDEVRQFKQVHKEVVEFCASFKYNFASTTTLLVPSTHWNAEFNFTTYDCGLISHYLLWSLHDRYEKQMKGLHQKKKIKPTRTHCWCLIGFFVFSWCETLNCAIKKDK